MFDGETTPAGRSKILATALGIPHSSVRSLHSGRQSNDKNPKKALLFTVSTKSFDEKVGAEKKARSNDCRTQGILPRFLHQFATSFRESYSKKNPNCYIFFRPNVDHDAFNISVKDNNTPGSSFKFIEKLPFPIPQKLANPNFPQRCTKSSLLTPEELVACIPQAFDV